MDSSSANAEQMPSWWDEILNPPGVIAKLKDSVSSPKQQRELLGVEVPIERLSHLFSTAEDLVSRIRQEADGTPDAFNRMGAVSEAGAWELATGWIETFQGCGGSALAYPRFADWLVLMVRSVVGFGLVDDNYNNLHEDVFAIETFASRLATDAVDSVEVRFDPSTAEARRQDSLRRFRRDRRKEFRLSRELTINQMKQRAADLKYPLSAATVENWVSGHRVTDRSRAKIAQIFNISVKELPL